MSTDVGETLAELDETKVECFVETMYLAAASDGELSVDEHTQLSGVLHSLVQGTGREGTFTPQKLHEWLETSRQRLGNEGRDARLQAIKQTLGTSAICKRAIGFAIQVLAADGRVRTSEREFLFDLGVIFEVDQDEVADLMRDLTRPPVN